jgi:hypothetical protein
MQTMDNDADNNAATQVISDNADNDDASADINATMKMTR